MRVLVACDGFKGCLSAAEACAALARGLRAGGARAEELPLADGGEGFTRALIAAAGGTLHRAPARDPLGRAREAEFGVLPDGRAVVEVAAASGHTLLTASERDAGRATSRGTGELIAAAAALGCREVLLGLGGSATNDAGAGLAAALGVRLLDAAGAPLGPGGLALAALARLEVPPESLAARLKLVAACDVDNPLCGPRGASRTYGPQKGADPGQVAALDLALERFAAVAARDLGREVAEVPGAGAAGGIGAGLLALGGALVRGAPLVLDAVGFEGRLAEVDLVLTGEGQLDLQTACGKLPWEVAQRAVARGVPVVAVAGRVAPEAREALYAAGFASLRCLADGPLDLATSLAEAPRLLEQVGRDLAAGWRGCVSLHPGGRSVAG